MNGISHDKWTVVAVNDAPGHWRWVHPGFATKESRAALFAASKADEAIVMHRITPDGTQMVARLAGRWWRRFQKNPEHAARRRA